MQCQVTLRQVYRQQSVYVSLEEHYKVQGCWSQETKPGGVLRAYSCVRSFYTLPPPQGSCLHPPLTPPASSWPDGLVLPVQLTTVHQAERVCDVKAFCPRPQHVGTAVPWATQAHGEVHCYHLAVYLFKAFMLSEPWGSCKREMVTPPSIAGRCNKLKA